MSAGKKSRLARISECVWRCRGNIALHSLRRMLPAVENHRSEEAGDPDAPSTEHATKKRLRYSFLCDLQKSSALPLLGLVAANKNCSSSLTAAARRA